MKIVEKLSTQYRFRLVSFADGSYIWRHRGKRFKKEATVSGCFKDVIIYNNEKLFGIKSISSQSKQIINKKNYGYGYWLWKPYIINHELSNLDKSYDGLIYLDVGCVFNLNTDSLKRMKYYLEYTIKNGILTFHIPGFIEKQWTSKFVLDSLNVGMPERETYQRLAGVLFFKNSDQSREIVKHWLDKCTQENHKFLIGSATGKSPHRYDQSLWSVISKKHGIPSCSDETYFAPNWKAQGKNFPIWTKRKYRNIDLITKTLFNFFFAYKPQK